MDAEKVWGIVGAGWLGGELLNHLDNLGIKHWETTSTSFNWLQDDFPSNPYDIILINIPPLPSMPPAEFVGKIPSNLNQRIIFISSIAVYGELTGIVKEDSPVRPKTPNGIWLHAVEQLLLLHHVGKSTIIRPGGLIGGSRHPIHSLSRDPSRQIQDGPINLIHRIDLIEIIMTVSQMGTPPAIVNAVTPYHPLKSSYYTRWAKKLNLDAPKFSSSKKLDRIVTSEYLPYLHPSWHFPELDKL